MNGTRYETINGTTFCTAPDGTCFVVAFVRYSSPIGYGSGNLIIDQCPLCGGYHRHGDSAQLGNNYGTRSPHCYEQPAENLKQWRDQHPEVVEYLDADYLLVDTYYRKEVEVSSGQAPAETEP